MIVKTIDLYNYFSLRAPEGADGKLICIANPTSHEVSRGRVRPAVLVLPGGGYGFTSDREAEPVAFRFLAQGYAAFILRYSVAPLAFPTALREACMAMRYIRENAAEFEVAPNMVSAIGFSAGGHLCGTLGTMYDCPEVADLGDAQLLRPDALGLCYPVALSWGPTHEGSFDNLTRGDTELRKRLSLDALARADMPPTFLWHTRNDDAGPVRNSILLANTLADLGVDFALHVFPNGPHGLSCANDTVYSAHGVPVCSADIPGWPETMIQFFRDMGLKPVDKI